MQPNWLDRCVVYDVEIINEVKTVPGGWDNPEAMGFASGVAYDYRRDRYEFFLHPESKDGLLTLLDGRIAITFNGIKFDSRVILGNDRKLTLGGATKTDRFIWSNYDLLLEYIKARFSYATVGEAEGRLGDKAIHDGSFGLDGLAEGTFGMHKTGHGAHAPVLYAEKKYDELLDYNLHDVRLTKKLFEFVLEYGFMVNRMMRVVKINVPKKFPEVK